MNKLFALGMMMVVMMVVTGCEDDDDGDTYYYEPKPQTENSGDKTWTEGQGGNSGSGGVGTSYQGQDYHTSYNNPPPSQSSRQVSLRNNWSGSIPFSVNGNSRTVAPGGYETWTYSGGSVTISCPYFGQTWSDGLSHHYTAVNGGVPGIPDFNSTN